MMEQTRENMEELYQDLTGINILDQRVLWDERGKGYYGEYLLFKSIYQKVQGCCKILMNLQIPMTNGKTTEIDLLLIHESGLYVFEAKHYKGTIYGKEDDTKWTQYFRTTKNSSFYNPILQNKYHIKALENKFSDIPIYSMIVFTNPECDLKIDYTSENISVRKLEDMFGFLGAFSTRNTVMNTEKIESIFRELVDFSPMKERMISVNEKIIPFHDYIHLIIKEYGEEKNLLEQLYVQKQKELQDALKREQNELENRYHKKEVQLKNGKKAIIIGAFVSCMICISMCFFSIRKYKVFSEQQVAIARRELDEFAKKFERVDSFNGGELEFESNLAEVSNVIIESSIDLKNTTIVQFDLTHTGKDYGILIHSESAIVVILKDGSVKEYPIYNEKYPFERDVYLGSIAFGSSCSILPHELYDLSVNEIDYWTIVKPVDTIS